MRTLHISIRKFVFVLIPLQIVLLSGCAQPASLTTLHRFPVKQVSKPLGSEPYIASQGCYPLSPLTLSRDGDLYGLTSEGGLDNGSGSGTVYKINPQGELTTLHAFSQSSFAAAVSLQGLLHPKNSDGAKPSGSLVLASDGSFYGATKAGGVNGYGTVFKVDPSGSLTTLHAFSNSDGAVPTGGLMQAVDGSFYGTTEQGGAQGFGTVFKLSLAGIFTTLCSFKKSDGAHHDAALIEAGGGFYGTTSAGGAYGSGTVFKMNRLGAIIVIHSFSALNGKEKQNTDGATPEAALVVATDGKLYGTTNSGGTESLGTLFSVTTSGVFTVLSSFELANGGNSQAALIQAQDGNLYGTAKCGGKINLGTVFKATLTGAIIAIHSFDAVGGCCPCVSLVQAKDGSFYGTTSDGGIFGYGTIFDITPDGVFTKLNGFNLGDTAVARAASMKSAYADIAQSQIVPNGVSAVRAATSAMFQKNESAQPRSPLVEGADGAFYGTICSGGAYGFGEVYKITASGTMSSVNDFNVDDGAFPCAILLKASDGNFYGTTQFGGAYGGGTVFRLKPTGDVSTIFSFANVNNSGNVGSEPCAGLIQGKDGSFYGVTATGGDHNSGTIYKVTPSGVYVTLHTFIGVDGISPQDVLVQGRDGSFFGTTSMGGANNTGTVFRFTLPDSFKVLHHFTTLDDGQWNHDGANTHSGLVLADDGCFYSMTYTGGRYGNGTIYKITSSGEFTVLHQLKDEDGAQSVANLIQAKDGNFYGVTYDGGGANSMGTIFRMDRAGHLTVIYAFDGTNGSYPDSGLMQASDGNLYGTTAGQNSVTEGTIFQLRLAGN